MGTFLMSVFIAGLSPLARGTRRYAWGITVGCAVYPRWRGEHESMMTLSP
ncbi:hypothetical protein ITU92_004622 [Salmonella enterica]|nr:hypothetical protein [Salmonella enterica]